MVQYSQRKKTKELFIILVHRTIHFVFTSTIDNVLYNQLVKDILFKTRLSRFSVERFTNWIWPMKSWYYYKKNNFTQKETANFPAGN